ncbi:iron-containing alcohol dehydrogenase [uncultured Fusobacterium sp.]|uniref:iron-containing alcohol dehydrogenase n=1 Tax=uncultured Fusobacterium sp. TaxID=159267 RepID=UPI002598AE73|nr:iron-containing alcohol dehydrogenase [uncultured Fusobacterium sp.]
MEIFQATTEIFTGIGVEEVLKNLQFRKIIFITDSMMRKVGLAEKIENILKSMDIKYKIFDGVEVDPSLESIKKALDIVIDFSPEMLIALGGGSTLDSAKAVSYFMKNTGIEIPVLAIPTTCGTGSEVTSYAVITDRENNVKIPIKDDEMVPKIAVLDPEFTKTLPKVVVADGGIDALTHAIESYTCKNANLYTQIYAMAAIRGIFKNILKMYRNIEDKEARIEMGKASCIAGFAFEKSGLGINHSLAHAIGGKFHKSHGRSNGTILPYIIRFNSSDSETAKRYYEISKEMEFPCSSVAEGAESLAVAVEVLNKALGLPGCVREMGVDEKEYMKLIPEMAETALKDMCTSGNMKKVDSRDLENLLKKVF